MILSINNRMYASQALGRRVHNASTPRPKFFREFQGRTPGVPPMSSDEPQKPKLVYSEGYVEPILGEPLSLGYNLKGKRCRA